MKIKGCLFYMTCVLLLLFFACSEESSGVEEMDPPECEESYSFSSDIQGLINSSCAYAGCHVSGTGLPPLTNYQQVVTQIENGKFEDRVLIRQNMPPSNASGPTELSESDLHLLSCWIDQGYAE
jgi:hypothetical protein